MGDLGAQFTAFSKFGDSKSEGKTITLTQIDKWMKQAGVFDKKLTTTDTGIEFGKFKAKVIDLKTFNQFLDNLAKAKGMSSDDIKKKLINCGAPGTPNTTQASHVGGVDRLTDTSKYTGSHKERFDESGKGKGIEGREDRQDNSGYVGNYKGQGICFNKFKTRKLTFKLFQEFLQDLANEVGAEYDELKDKLENCGLPGTTKKAETSKT